jgi:hypothetical protein
MKHLGFITLTLIVLALTACASGTAPAVEAPPPTAELGVAPAYPEPAEAPVPAYPEPAATLPSPTATPEPTAKTAGQRTEPQVVLEIDGQAETVTDNYELPACGKAVFYWTVDVGASGVASLIALLHDVAAEREEVLVNEVALEAGGDTVTWPALRLLDAGEYYFTTENTDEPWSLRVECQDGMAPVAEGLDVSGEGLTVTDNYQLRACSKSVFAWSIEPNASGAASAIVELYKAGLDQPVVVANEFQMDATQPVTGQSVRSVSAGPHYLFVYNTANRWRVTWECQD